MSTVTPYLLINESEQTKIRSTIDAALIQWQQRWQFGANPISAFEVFVNQDFANRYNNIEHSTWDCIRMQSVPEPGIYYASTEMALTALASEISVDTDQENVMSSMLRILCNKIITGLAESIFQQFFPNEPLGIKKEESCNIEGDVDKVGNGAILIIFNIAEHNVLFLLNSRFAQEMRVPYENNTNQTVLLSSYHVALRRQRIELSGWVGHAEIPLGELSRLCIGDTLVLDKKLLDPIDVAVMGHDGACHGHLGQHDEHRALQLST